MSRVLLPEEVPGTKRWGPYACTTSQVAPPVPQPVLSGTCQLVLLVANSMLQYLSLESTAMEQVQPLVVDWPAGQSRWPADTWTVLEAPGLQGHICI